MAEAASPTNTDKPDPLEIAFGESGVPEDVQVTSNRVRCSPLDHHADLLPIGAGVQIGKTFGHDELRGGGLMTAAEVIRPAYQLVSEFGDRVTGGFFADVMTPAHEAYPMTVFYGFRLRAARDGFRFANAVGETLTAHFGRADISKTSRKQLLVVTNTDPFPHQLVAAMRE